ncbi:MAG: hypothetical protein JST36_08135 [Bacteroidetes bacterium]|nr:hypothetical protein [Bacteroidota bacterium]
MKKLPLITLGLLFLSISLNAKIFRVNNTFGVAADYSTISAAVSGASSGDTLYIEGSATAYSNSLTISKRLVIYGPGIFLSDTANHKTQWFKHSATATGTWTFAAGSAKSKVSGMSLNSYLVLNDSDIAIARCYIAQVYMGNSSNVKINNDTIRQCYIAADILSNGSGSGFTATGEMIYNNIINGALRFTNNLNAVTAYVINNDFLYPTTPVTKNCVYQNNIFYQCDFGVYGAANYFANNIFTNSSVNAKVDTGNNNQFSVGTTGLFISGTAYPYSSFSTPIPGYSHDGQFKLAATSPAVGAGRLNGSTVDCGAYGGVAPYILSCMPNLPSIYSLTVPSQVNDGVVNMSISLSAASH